MSIRMVEVQVPIDKNSNCSTANIKSDDEVSKNNPASNKSIITNLNYSYFDLGDFFIIFFSGGLKPNAVAGGPSVTKFT